MKDTATSDRRVSFPRALHDQCVRLYDVSDGFEAVW